MIWNEGPLWRISDIFCVNQLWPWRGSSINQKSSLPNSDQHILPLILKMTMNVNVGIIHQFRVNRCQHFHIHRWFGSNRGFLNHWFVFSLIAILYSNFHAKPQRSRKACANNKSLEIKEERQGRLRAVQEQSSFAVSFLFFKVIIPPTRCFWGFEALPARPGQAGVNLPSN